MILRMRVPHIINIKSEIWVISHCFGLGLLGHKKVSAVFRAILSWLQIL